ncbi:MAG: CoA pyrophosphatase [Thermoleophilia bacterium]|nr:CoA pyrophosphatase [Thermoleophilia bacterium]
MALDKEAIRSRLQSAGLTLGAAGRCWNDLPASDALPAGTPPSGIPAAVLIALLAHPDGPRLILTERTAHLKNHAAQISFPGGRIEDGDAGPAEAALREAFEEIGLLPENVDLLGCLPCHLTVSHFLVHPVVGWVEPPAEFVPDPHEVAGVFDVPLSFVLDPANHHRESRLHDGVLRSYYVLPYPGHRIWGATAEILVELAAVLT